METKEIALLCAKALSAKKAKDITIVDISQRSSFSDYFVIASAGSLRMMSSLSDEVEDKLAKENVLVKHIEGKGESGWILMDYGDLIVNIFTEEQRNKYQIEKIWNDCPSYDYDGEEE